MSNQNEVLALLANYNTSNLLYKLQQRGVNPLRAEAIAIIEFLPLAIENNSNSNQQYRNLNFGGGPLNENATRAAKFAEVQRIIKETDYNSIVALIEKESGIKVSLMKKIIDYFSLLLKFLIEDANSEEYMSNIFTSDFISVSEAARNLLNEHFVKVNHTGLHINKRIQLSTKRSGNIYEEVLQDVFSTNDSFNFTTTAETSNDSPFLNLENFFLNNILNPRLILLVRCAILHFLSEKAVLSIKENSQLIDDLIRAISLIEIVNTEEEIETDIGQFIHNQSYNLSNSPLSHVNISIGSAFSMVDAETGEIIGYDANQAHSLGISNSFLFLNVIGALISELLFYDNRNPTDLVYDVSADENLSKEIQVRYNITYVDLIAELKRTSHRDILSPFNLYGNTTNTDSLYGQNCKLTEDLYDNAVDIMCYCIYNEVVGDNVFLLGNSAITNFSENNVAGNYNHMLQYSDNDGKHKLLAKYINKTFLKVAPNNSRKDKVAPIKLSELEIFPDYLNLSPNTSGIMGMYTKSLLALRKEKLKVLDETTNNISSQETGNKYIFLETSKGIIGQSLSELNLSNAENLIPVEDAIAYNIINNPNFNNQNPMSDLYPLFNSANRYANDTNDIAKDIISLFGIGYENDTGSFQEIANDSKNSKVAASGVTPLNYFSYFLEGISLDIKELVEEIDNMPRSPSKKFIGTANSINFDINDISNNFTRCKLLTIALILNANNAKDYDRLFRAFYFNEDTIDDGISLGFNMGSYPANSDADQYEKTKIQYGIEATFAVDELLNKLLESFDVGGLERASRDFVGTSTWSSNLYHGGILENFHSGPVWENIGSYSSNQIEVGNPNSSPSLDLEIEGADRGDNNTLYLLEIANSYAGGAGQKKILQVALKAPLDSKTYDADGSDDLKSALRIGNHFFHRLITSPILYSKIKGLNGSELGAGAARNAVNAQGKTSSDYSQYRFRGVRKYYQKNDDGDLTERDSNVAFTMGGIDQLTHIQKCYAIFMWYIKLLKTSLKAKVAFYSSNSGFPIPDHEFQIKLDINQLRGLAHALNLNETSGFENTEDINEKVFHETFKTAKDYIDETLGKITSKKKQIITKLNILGKNATDIKKESTNLINSFNAGNEGGLSSFLKNIMTSKASNFLLSRDAIGSATKYYYDHLRIENNSFPVCKYDKKEIKEYKQMYQALSSKGYNLLENESLGRKSILNVGIPAGLVDTLAEKSYNITGDDQFLDSSLIAIYLHRKNELNDEESVYPRPFVFDTTKYISSINALTNETFPNLKYHNSLKEGNFIDQQSLNMIIQKTSFLMSDRNRPDATSLAFIDNGTGLSSMNVSLVDGEPTLGTNYINEQFITDVCANHIFDYYLKMYQNLMLDMEFENYNFILENENLYQGNIDQDVIVNRCQENFKNFLRAYFPSFNVDQSTNLLVTKALNSYNNLMFNNQESKLTQLASGILFDRVFSIAYSDRDFIIKPDNGDYSSIFNNIPNVHMTSRSQFTPQDVNTIVSPIQFTETEYTKQIRSPGAGSIYKFYITVNLLKRW